MPDDKKSDKIKKVEKPNKTDGEQTQLADSEINRVDDGSDYIKAIFNVPVDEKKEKILLFICLIAFIALIYVYKDAISTFIGIMTLLLFALIIILGTRLLGVSILIERIIKAGFSMLRRK